MESREVIAIGAYGEIRKGTWLNNQEVRRLKNVTRVRARVKGYPAGGSQVIQQSAQLSARTTSTVFHNLWQAKTNIFNV